MEHTQKDNGDELWQVGNESLLRDQFGRWELFELNQPKGVPQKQPRSLYESEALEVLERFGARHEFQVREAREELAEARTEHEKSLLRVRDAYRRRKVAAEALRALGEEV